MGCRGATIVAPLFSSRRETRLARARKNEFMSGRSAALSHLLVLFLVILAAYLSTASPVLAERSVTDMAGRTVRVPDRISRVATIGAVPVLNSFVFALGQSATIANNLPPNLGGARWRFQYVVAPDLAKRPVVQSSEGPIVEGVVQASPDVVLTMDRKTVDLMERVGIPAIFLSWRQPDDVKDVMRLLGELYQRQDAAEAYCRYFDDTLAKVSARTEALSLEQRPRVLYASLDRLTQPHRIAEWWIEKAGGRSVTDNGRTAEAFNFSIEQVLDWNPEVIFVSAEREIAAAYANPVLASVSAIKNRRVYAVPMGVHVWGNRTVEQPLTVLWAAKLIHPDTFGDTALESEVRSFYENFLGTSLSDEDIREILEGRAGQHR
ncbi:ABC transporter substrate-binding protein [Hyphomicrobium sp. LHD-15]|uniref:ABC transporter substrate-binding protein n=1 Tax=Hyphomicrobium sp. LHD-15 TaxID=3072142 RepID=UPI002810747C|nr:ABC transporter substrate-binding protein [Hyphomicrobium sp. LHD-15]MDQ8700842.1 ABC transporter substrate-binding protein [Hyphomicrobium sp. LHD-15]